MGCKNKNVFNVLNLNDEEYKEFFSKLSNEKVFKLYDELKKQTNFGTLLELLSDILEAYRFPITKSLADELLNDDDLREFLLENNTVNNKLSSVLSNALKTIESDDDLDEEEADEIVNEANKYVDKDVEDYPLYTPLKEKLVLGKYGWLQTMLDVYLKTQDKRPDVQAFKEYVANYYDNDEMDKRTRGKNKDPFIVRAVFHLCRNVDEPAIVNMQNDKEVAEIINALKDLRDDIVFHNLRLVRAIAKKYVDRGLSLRDLDQEGRLGLLKAINKMDVSLGNRFSTYAVYWIRQAIKRILQNEGHTIRIPVNLGDRLNNVKKVKSLIIETTGREDPSIEEIYKKCRELNYPYSLEQVKNALKADAICDPISADKPVGEDEDGAYMIDFLTAKNTEKTSSYAEFSGLEDGVRKILDEFVISEHKKATEFIQLTFADSEGEKKFILLTSEEYKELSKSLSSKEKREKMLEFLNKYGLDANLSFIGKEPIILTEGERKAFVYAYRNGIKYEAPGSIMTTERFMKRRNLNDALIVDGLEKAESELTLEEIGKLFGVTRERIRQIEAKANEKVRPYLTGKDYVVKDFCDVDFDGEVVNVYNLLGVSLHDPEYKLLVPTNDHISIDEFGNIIPFRKGKVTIRLKSEELIKELQINVNPPSNIKKQKIVLKPEEEKKDSQ